MWGAAQLARMKEWGDGRGPARLGAPKWKPNGQLQLDGGVLVVKRVPRIADSV